MLVFKKHNIGHLQQSVMIIHDSQTRFTSKQSTRLVPSGVMSTLFFFKKVIRATPLLFLAPALKN